MMLQLVAIKGQSGGDFPSFRGTTSLASWPLLGLAFSLFFVEYRVFQIKDLGQFLI